MHSNSDFGFHSPLLLGTIFSLLLTINLSLGSQPEPELHIPSHQTHGSGTDNFNRPWTGSGKQGALAQAATIAAGYLFADSTDKNLNLSDPIDEKLLLVLQRHGPDMRPSRDFKDPADISVDVAKRAWRLLHKHAGLAVSNRIDLVQPLIEQTLIDARTSFACQYSIRQTFEGAKRMESWAIKILNSWGNFPPIGIFEGTYSEVGSFHTCVNVDNNRYIDHAHYCTITYRPVMPSRKNYELVVKKEPTELLELFNELPENTTNTYSSIDINLHASNKSSTRSTKLKDAFQDILEHSQYHHYVYYKWATCWPINCSPFDIKRLAKLLGRRNILMNGPVKCYSKNERDYEEPGNIDLPPTNVSINRHSSADEPKKLVISIWDLNDGIFIWKPHFNKGQKVALTIILIATTFIVIMSLLDLFLIRLPNFLDWFSSLLENSKEQTAVASNNNNPLVGTVSNHHVESEYKSSDIHQDRQFLQMKLRPDSLMLDGRLSLATNTSASDTVQQQINKLPNDDRSTPLSNKQAKELELSPFKSLLADCSVFNNAAHFFAVSENQLKNDILCLNGIRCITMIWIIMTHTMMYNDWSAFARTRDIEKSLKSLVSQPVFNGSYLVDTFFLMSGLLSAFTAFKHCQGLLDRFNSFAYIFGRWLRLTPQIFFVSMIFIVLPAVSYGPHWFPMVGEYSENCIDNWWVNVLHLQAFYDKEKMCNFVTWWISIDFFYHFFALAVVWIVLLAGHKTALASITALVASQVVWEAMEHYRRSYPPNVFSTIPQTGAMWTEFTLGFFWTPYTHAVPFASGFYIGYLMALKRKLIVKQLNNRRAILGWTMATSLLVAQSYSTYWWVTGISNYSRLVSTIFYVVCPIIWASSLSWIIIACHHGYGGWVNRFLSAKVFIVLGKASYLVYLSHFQVMFIFYGNQNLLLEPSQLTMFYIIVGNIFLSTLWGIFLCIVYELPWLRIHKKLMKYV